MALTPAQLKAIKEQTRKNIADRAKAQAKKISPKEARVASSGMKRGDVPTYRGPLRDKPLLSKSEADANAKSNKDNAKSEKTRQKQRRFAKGEGKLPLKERVGTKAEYKQFGKEIQLRKDLIAAAKKADASRAARKANAPTQTTPAKKADTVATKKTTESKPKTPKPQKASTAAIKARTSPNIGVTPSGPKPKTKAKTKSKTTAKLQTLDEAKAKAPTPKASTGSKLQTLEQAKSKAPTPKTSTGPKLQTLAEAKAKAPTPKPVSDTPRAADTPKKASIKSAAKANVKGALGKTSTGKTIIAAANTTAGKKVVSAPKSALQKITSNKKLRRFAKGSVAIPLAIELGSSLKGSTEKDFKEIQRLENKLSALKGQKPKYTNMGSNKNVLSGVKTDLANIASNLTAGIVGKTRRERMDELNRMINKVQKPGVKPSVKPGAKPPVGKSGNGGKSGSAPVAGNKYRVSSGDTLSGIASRAGVSLADLRAANPQITDPKKIFRNTAVKIPKAGKMPSGGYTGAVPYKGKK